MNHKPTFRLTPQRRPWYRRLTPLAWLLIVMGIVIVAILGKGLIEKFGGEKDTPLTLPAASAPAAATDTQPSAAATNTQPPTAAPTAVPPTLTALPPTPTQWQVETLAPTLAPTASPTPEGWVWWADQMTCNEQGECAPPAEVADEIVAAYWEWQEAIPAYIVELDMTPEQLEHYYTGEILQLQLEFVELVKETGAMWDGETIVRQNDYEILVPYVTSCTVDGLTCLLGVTVQGNLTIYEYDLGTRQIVNTIQNPQDKQYHGVTVWRYQYDLENGRWKVERYYEWIPAPSP